MKGGGGGGAQGGMCRKQGSELQSMRPAVKVKLTILFHAAINNDRNGHLKAEQAKWIEISQSQLRNMSF